MTPAPTPEQIAAGLSEAQKRYLTDRAEWLKPTVWAEKRWMTFPPTNVLRVLRRHGLADSNGSILDLGLEVRAILESQTHAR